MPRRPSFASQPDPRIPAWMMQPASTLPVGAGDDVPDDPGDCKVCDYCDEVLALSDPDRCDRCEFVYSLVARAAGVA